MSYRRDFTIGLRETQQFQLMLVMDKWRGGILGFGVVGALVAWMYLMLPDPVPPLPVRLGFAAAAAVLAAAGTALILTVSTLSRVRGQVRRSGRASYVQETEIDGFGVRVTVGKDRARLGFDRLVRVRETRGAFYLFIAEHQAWILPKAQMEDREAECRTIREILRKVVERSRLRLRK